MKKGPMRKITRILLSRFVTKRKKDAHKRDFGKILVIGGSKGMTGAAVLAARAALKAGAGLVTVACPSSERKVVAVSLPEAMTFDGGGRAGFFSKSCAGRVLSFAEEGGFDLSLIGPGLSLENEVPDFVVRILKEIRLPLVIDADALNAAALKGIEKIFPLKVPAILTPHPGELKRLVKERAASRLKSAKALKEKTRAVVVAKGLKTLVLCGDEVFENTSGGPSLAKGGSGDVLAGLISGLWGQFKDRGFDAKTAFMSALTGVYLHGLCGDLAAKKLTERCVLAGELLDFLPLAYRKIAKI